MCVCACVYVSVYIYIYIVKAAPLLHQVATCSESPLSLSPPKAHAAPQPTPLNRAGYAHQNMGHSLTCGWKSLEDKLWKFHNIHIYIIYT